MPAFKISFSFITITQDQEEAARQTATLRGLCKGLGFDPGASQIKQLSDDEISQMRLGPAVARLARERYGPEAEGRQADRAREALVSLTDGNLAPALLLIKAIEHHAGALPRVFAQAITDAAAEYAARADVAPLPPPDDPPPPPPPPPPEDGPGEPTP